MRLLGRVRLHGMGELYCCSTVLSMGYLNLKPMNHCIQKHDSD